MTGQVSNLPVRAIALASLAGLALAAPPPAKPGPKPAPKKPRTGLWIGAQGLRPDSNRHFLVFKSGRYFNRGRVGQALSVPPGKYEVRLGFSSGWLTREHAVEGGKLTTVPTGLFRFARIMSAGSSAVPQTLFHGQRYLVTGYRDLAARLYPGTYRVYYREPRDRNPCRSLKGWKIAGPFFKKGVSGAQSILTPFPPDENPGAIPPAGYRQGNRKLPWRSAPGTVSAVAVKGKRPGGTFYLHKEIVSDKERAVLIAFNARYGARVWLNGKPVNETPAPADRSVRVVGGGRLRKGKNLLLVKAFGGSVGHWPFTCELEHVRSYRVEVTPDKPPRCEGAPGPAAPPAEPLPDTKGIVFCKVHDFPDGRSGLHYEQFRIVRRPQSASICSLIPAAPGGKLTNLTRGRFKVAIDPRISYDGKRFLFSAKKEAADKWTIYEMNVDGSGLRQVTRNAGNCINPCYLPGGRICFSSDVNSDFRDEYDRDVPLLLFTAKPDGADLDQITFNLSSDIDPFVLDDGRICFTSWQHHGDHEGVAGDFALFTVFPDGTAFMPYTLPRPGLSKTKSYAQQLTDGHVVFVETAGHRHYNGGTISVVHPRKPAATKQVLSKGMRYDGYNLAGRFASPYPLPKRAMLCSFSPGRGTSRLELDPFEEIHMGIYTFDFESGRAGRLIYDDPASQDIDANAIYARPEPTVIPRVTLPGRKTGTLTCQNAYLSDRPKTTRYPVVGRLPPAKPGEIEAVRILEGFGVHDKDRNKHKSTVIDILQMSFGSSSNNGNNNEQKRILGVAPVAPDGSFSVEVPADTTLFLQTLDANGMAIENQLTWMWVRPGETRMCIGCHEDRNTSLGNQDCEAMHRPATLIAPPEDKRRVVDFRRDIMPVVEKRCSSCHNAAKPAGGIDLRKGFELVFHRTGCRGRKLNAAMFNQAYETFLAADSRRVPRWVLPGAARHSPIMWCLYGKQLGLADARRDKGQVKVKQMPPKGRLPDKELKLIAEWIDCGAQWDNIVGEDDLPGYDAKQSAIMAKAAQKEVERVIAEPKTCFETRCLECHDMRKMASLKKIKDEEIQPLVKRMAAKRKGWIREPEFATIVKFIRDERGAGG